MPTSFTYVKKGYNPIEVDNYIDTLESVIKGYKEKDSAIKNAIINAQIAADNIVKDAETKSDQILAQIIQKVEVVKSSLDRQRQLVKSFQNDYNALIKKYVINFNESEIYDVYRDIDELEEFIIKISNIAPETAVADTDFDDFDDFALDKEDNAAIAALLK